MHVRVEGCLASCPPGCSHHSRQGCVREPKTDPSRLQHAASGHGTHKDSAETLQLSRAWLPLLGQRCWMSRWAGCRGCAHTRSCTHKHAVQADKALARFTQGGGRGGSNKRGDPGEHIPIRTCQCYQSRPPCPTLHLAGAGEGEGT